MSSFDPRRNALLARLPQAVMQRLAPHVTLMVGAPGGVLLDAAATIDAIYFPLDLVVSLDQSLAHGGAATEATAPAAALTGSEGAIGIESFLGATTSINRSTVRVGGSALRVGAAALREEFARAGEFHCLLLRFADALFAQVCAVSACERVHPVGQRLIRWLLVFDDRSPRGGIALTQESLAQLLGVRRASVSAAASRLQATGLIAYRRGHIVILERGGLEALACKCYRDIKSRYDENLACD